MEGEPADERTTEDIVAAFRHRRAGSAGTATAAATTPPDLPAGARPQQPAPSPSPSSPPPPPPSPPSAVSAAPLAPAAASGRAAEDISDVVLPWPDAGRSVAVRPAVQGATSLAAAGPALNLTDRLLADRFVASRGHRGAATAGVVVALLGTVVLAVTWFGVPGWRFPTLDKHGATAGSALVLAGLAVAVLFSLVPRTRQVRVRFAPTQRAEWDRLQHESRRLRNLLWTGAGLAAGGLVLAAALRSGSLVVFGVAWLLPLLLAVTGLLLLGWVAARRSLLQRLYVQTLVLSRLEHTGLGPAGEPDARIGPVLRSLDKLLGALPESAVRRFLASDEATAYLELMDELEGRRRG